MTHDPGSFRGFLLKQPPVRARCTHLRSLGVPPHPTVRLTPSLAAAGHIASRPAATVPVGDYFFVVSKSNLV